MTGTTANGTTQTATRKVHRLSLQRPAGLPAIPNSTPPLSARSPSTPRHRVPFDIPDVETSGSLQTSDSEDEGGEYTLIGCLAGLSISSLPPMGDEGKGPVISRFPHPAPAPPSSTLGSREEQRRIYLGPKLSDRATGGPDAGPLIERFSCLFKDREFQVLPHSKFRPELAFVTYSRQNTIALPIQRGLFQWEWRRIF